MYSLLLYDYVDDIVERRTPFRDGHLALVREAHSQGVLLMAGAFAEPVDGAVFVFTTDNRSVMEDFVSGDPYVREGLVTAWRIRLWNVVIGGPAAGQPSPT
ncbi:MAG: YciI-like protein [Actinomycetota bacterium]|nr:YciI-like protein [Actinomycetota bacterium]